MESAEDGYYVVESTAVLAEQPVCHPQHALPHKHAAAASLQQLPTPSYLVRMPVVARNCARMAQRAAAAGVALRPHVKTCVWHCCSRSSSLAHFPQRAPRTLANAVFSSDSSAGTRRSTSPSCSCRRQPRVLSSPRCSKRSFSSPAATAPSRSAAQSSRGACVLWCVVFLHVEAARSAGTSRAVWLWQSKAAACLCKTH
jgi:hypothetical protein